RIVDEQRKVEAEVFCFCGQLETHPVDFSQQSARDSLLAEAHVEDPLNSATASLSSSLADPRHFSGHGAIQVVSVTPANNGPGGNFSTFARSDFTLVFDLAKPHIFSLSALFTPISAPPDTPIGEPSLQVKL